ncbi:peroxisomal targeting signal receptor [Ceratobasidium sp. AG-Ba]|nr:peroxisomal targeting signal receptor [Ceratobasidium sp. AG-Ba]
MAFNAMMSGADCAIDANPLSQMLKHTERESSFQRDRIGGTSSGRLQHLPSTQASHSASATDLAHANEFFTQRGPSAARSLPFSPQAFGLNTPGGSKFVGGPSQADFEAAFNASKGRMGSPADLMAMSNMRIESSPGPSAWAQEWSSFQGESKHAASVSSPLSHMPMGQFGHPTLSSGFYMPHMMQTPVVSTDKGKAKAQDAEFEAAFARFEEITKEKENEADSTGTTDMDVIWNKISAAHPSSSSSLHRTDLAAFEAELQAKREAAAAEDDGLDDKDTDYAAIMRELGREASAAEAAEAEAEYAEAMREMWESGLGDYGGPDAGFANIGDGGVVFDGNGVPAMEQYKFDESNPHLTEGKDARSLLDAAKEILANPSGTGSLREAGLLLEAAIQKGELGTGGYEAWVLLGEVRGMDERESEGLVALREGVNRGAPPEALLSLAISYTNESYNRAAQYTLRQYLATRFPSLVSEADTRSDSLAPWAGHELTAELFLRVARAQHASGEPVDADLQSGLGTLYYANAEYDKAADCFAAALGVRPKDYLLWNRYGSCLSNSNHPAEALDAYREALQLRPGYTRAIYNVGVACMNIDAYHEAAEHFLGALVVQGGGSGGPSGSNDNDPLWTTLQRTFVLMDRSDLAEIARGGRNVEDFRSRGFNF